jgi:hypothetical protein
MRASKAGWSRDDLVTLYEGFGFTIRYGSSHDIVKHPEYPALRATLPRHDDLAKAYVDQAIKLIERLKQLQGGGSDARSVGR